MIPQAQRKYSLSRFFGIGCCIAAVFGWGACGSAAEQTASVVGHATAFYMGPALNEAQGETVFTTTDNWPECPPPADCCPRFVQEGIGRPRGSGEFQYQPGSPFGNYVADFYYYTDPAPRSHGRIGLTLPEVDSDQDGIADAVQVGMGFSDTVRGALDWTSGDLPFRNVECHLQRSAQSTLGTYTIKLPEGAMQREWRGTWSLSVLRGRLQYSKLQPNRVTVQVEWIQPDGGVKTFAGTTECEATGRDRFRMASTTLFGNAASPLLLREVEFVNAPGTNGFVALVDVGLPQWNLRQGALQPSACPEAVYPPNPFGKFTMVVVDPQDQDQNGLPDLLDACPSRAVAPVFRVEPEPQFVAPGSDVSLTSLADGAQPIEYQWHREGLVLSGATQRNLLLRRVTTNDAGVYHVVASNEYGSKSSRQVRLSVSRLSPQPKILQPLTGATIQPGSDMTFRVVADGEPVLAYQWYKDGIIVPSRSTPEFPVRGATPADIGDYAVVVLNHFGRTTSGPVSLVLTGFPPRPSIRALRLVARGPEIDCAVRAGVKYRLDSSLDAVQWSPLNQFTATNSTHTIKHNFASLQATRFYRLVALSGP